ncbi:MAG: hypothetical protein QNK23_05555 [Crocinitomicaceae bacterium]|nr:hypothetical protein [Crocinitomicaceae bacterium]
MKSITRLLLIGIIGLLISCQKEVQEAEIGSTQVDIVFTSPTYGSTFNGSGEISIEARVEADAMMAGYRVTITDKKTGEIVDTIDDLYEQTMYMVHHHWFPSVHESTIYEVKIEALEKNLLVLGENTLDITCTP